MVKKRMGLWLVLVLAAVSGAAYAMVARTVAYGPLVYYALATPCRLVDTQAAGTPADAGVPLAYPAQGACYIPPGARAIAVNAAVLAPGSDGQLTLFPGGDPVPSVVTLYFSGNGQPQSNGGIITLSGVQDGDLGAYVYTTQGTPVDLAIDVTGYFLPAP